MAKTYHQTPKFRKGNKNMNNESFSHQNVSEVLSLLQKTLDEEKNRIFSAGAEAMKNQDLETVKGVMDFINKLDVFSAEIQTIKTKWTDLMNAQDNLPLAVRDIVAGKMPDDAIVSSSTTYKTFDHTDRSNHSSDHGSNANGLFQAKRGNATYEFRNASHKHVENAAVPIYVLFPDGTRIQGRNVAETLTETINRIGPERVAQLFIITNNEYLVSKKRSEKYPGEVRQLRDGYYVITHSNTQSKIKYLQEISDRLGLNLKISLTR